MRLVVYDTKDGICADFEGTSDVFIKVGMEGGQTRETDTHFRC